MLAQHVSSRLKWTSLDEIGQFASYMLMFRKCPHRDGLCALCGVVLVRHTSVLIQWTETLVHSLKTHKRIKRSDQFCRLWIWSGSTHGTMFSWCLLIVTHRGSRAFGLLRRRRLVLGWTTKTQMYTAVMLIAPHTHTHTQMWDMQFGVI